MSALEDKYYTLQEYLVLEEQSEYRNEYINGRIIPLGSGDFPFIEMAGATPTHNLIKENLSIAIGSHLKKTKTCRSYSSDQRVSCFDEENSGETYPDLLVVCGKTEYDEIDKNAIINPILLIEVLSKSTRNYDRGDKFTLYRTIPNFKEYILVDSTRIMIEVWRKSEEGIWSLMQEVKNFDSIIEFKSIGLLLTVHEIYDQVEGLLSVRK
jgi:Uma2 family endonuclease